MRGFALAAVLALAATFTPTPYRLHAPGRVEMVAGMVSIETNTYPSKGAFLLPTVVSEPATVLYVLYSLLDPHATLTDVSADEPMAQTGQEQQMGASQYLATLVALEALGYELRGESRGLRVLGLNEDSPNLGVVQPGDLLKSVGGVETRTFKALKSKLDQHKPADKLDAEVERNGRITKLQLTTFDFQGSTLLGIFMRPEYDTELPFPISFDAGRTSGASGGLVFALEIYDRLTPEDLTGGHLIAATGTLDARGQVGPIQGVNLKMIGASRAGATVILIPKENVEELEGLPEGVQVIPVATFNEALHALEKL